MKRIVATFLFLVFPLLTVSAQIYSLYGGADHTIFMGTLNASDYEGDSLSLWNPSGTYGSKFSDDSIWNGYGTYGSKYNDLSPWNEYSEKPPIILDENGKSHGYFTVNKKYPNRTTIEWIVWIIDNYYFVRENPLRAYLRLIAMGSIRG
jgi:hypothetical protein